MEVRLSGLLFVLLGMTLFALPSGQRTRMHDQLPQARTTFTVVSSPPAYTPSPTRRVTSTPVPTGAATLTARVYLPYINNLEPHSDITRSTPAPGESIYIDEPVLLQASQGITPSLAIGNEFVLDFGEVTLVQSGTYNDFDVAYWTPSGCDTDVWVFNYLTRRWDQIGFSPGPDIVCIQVPTQHGHLFSARGLDAEEHLNEADEMKLRDMSER